MLQANARSADVQFAVTTTAQAEQAPALDAHAIRVLRAKLAHARRQAPARDQVAYELYVSGEVKLPPIPKVAMMLCSMLKRTDVKMADVVGLIEMDIALSASMLKMANSVAFMAGNPVSSIQSAVMRIGLRQAACLALSISTRSLFDEDVKAAMGFVEADSDGDWRQAVIVAHACRHVAARLGFPDGDQAYAGALFHGVGKALAIFVLASAATRDPSLAALSLRERRATVNRMRSVLMGEYLLREGLPVELISICMEVDASEEDIQSTTQLIRLVLGLVSALIGADHEQALYLDRAFAAAHTLDIGRSKLDVVKQLIIQSKDSVNELYGSGKSR